MRLFTQQTNRHWHFKVYLNNLANRKCSSSPMSGSLASSSLPADPLPLKPLFHAVTPILSSFAGVSHILLLPA